MAASESIHTDICALELLDRISDNQLQPPNAQSELIYKCGQCAILAWLDNGVSTHYGNDCRLFNGEIRTLSEI